VPELRSPSLPIPSDIALPPLAEPLGDELAPPSSD
jgi:hypothetical protein